jgi:hypothetical protein
MLHVPSFWDVGRSRNTSCYLSSLTNLEMQYLILVRCRIVVHPWNTISPSPFRPRFFVCGPPSATIPGTASTGRRGAFEWATTAIQTLRVASMKKLLNIVYWIGMAVSLELISFGVCCHFTIDAIMRIPFVFLPVCAGLTIGLCCVEHLLRQGR